MRRSPTEPKLISGKYAILAVVILAMAGAGYSWSYLYRLQRRPIKFWTPERAAAFLHATKVEALRLGPATGEQSGEVLSLPGGRRRIVEALDITGAPGLIHVRHALVHGGTYAEYDVPPVEPADWAIALRFSNEGDSANAVVVAFDSRARQVAASGATTVARVKSMRADSQDEEPRDPFAQFLSEQFP